MFFWGLGVGFIVTAIWNLLASKRNRKYQYLVVNSMYTAMNEMAQKLGHEDLHDYYEITKGKEHASVAILNITNTINSFTNRDA